MHTPKENVICFCIKWPILDLSSSVALNLKHLTCACQKIIKFQEKENKNFVLAQVLRAANLYRKKGFKIYQILSR